MLKLAVDAGIPLITARHSDVRNFNRLLAHLVGFSGVEIDSNTPMSTIKIKDNGNRLFWTEESLKPEIITRLVETLETQEGSLVLLNQDRIQEAFDVGLLAPPREYLRAGLIDDEMDEDLVDDILPALGGLTLKEARELVRLCQARERRLTPQGVVRLRREAFAELRGLQVVDTALPYYFQDPTVEFYIKWAGRFLLADCDLRLRPRGLLLTGVPGVGKTTAAKRIAQEIGVPLLRLDLGAIKGKYVGESEQAMGDALRQVEREAPCVLLIDEVEKLFGGGHNDEGTTKNLLASCLWWLAEHRERVLTVMTTNDSEVIPSELIRAGRLDQCTVIRPLVGRDAELFALNLAETFLKVDDGIADLIMEELNDYCEDERIPHSTLTDIVKGVVRSKIMGSDG